MAISEDARETEFAMSKDSLEYLLTTLSLLLKKHHGKPDVILIDDVPLIIAYELGYHDDFFGMYRSIFVTALKENDSLALPA